MAFKMLGGGSDVNTVVSDMNSNILEMINQDKTKFFNDDTGMRVVMLDKNGLKTTVPGGGIDVFTATDDQLSFNSNFRSLKYVESGTVTLTTGTVGAATSTTYTAVATLTGTYSIVPLVLAFYSSGSSVYGQWFGGAGLGVCVPYANGVSVSGITLNSAIFQKTLVRTTDITFTAVCTNASGSFTFPNFNIKYYVLQESSV